MFYHLKLLDLQVKGAMPYQHLSQTKRYQIYILMKDGKAQSQIAQLLNRHKWTITETCRAIPVISVAASSKPIC
jgi:DNA-binding NarL/FixJ family response regulator